MLEEKHGVALRIRLESIHDRARQLGWVAIDEARLEVGAFIPRIAAVRAALERDVVPGLDGVGNRAAELADRREDALCIARRPRPDRRQDECARLAVPGRGDDGI